jgi:hypothetical protein
MPCHAWRCFRRSGRKGLDITETTIKNYTIYLIYHDLPVYACMSMDG